MSGQAPQGPDFLPPTQGWAPPPAAGLAVLVVVLAAGATFVPAALTRPAAPTPSSSSTALPLVTVTPAAPPTAKTVLSSGGDLGAPVDFTSGTGTGRLTVTAATWTRAGRMAPPDKMSYLIVDVTVSCTGGYLDVSSLDLRTTTTPAAQSAFGSDLPDQFPGVRLTAGRTQAGQVGFVLPEGTVTLALLDPATLQPVVTRIVPGP